jgi:hypothetical protein
MACRPAYQPQLPHTTWGSLAEPQRGQTLRAGTSRRQAPARWLRLLDLTSLRNRHDDPQAERVGCEGRAGATRLAALPTDHVFGARQWASRCSDRGAARPLLPTSSAGRLATGAGRAVDHRARQPTWSLSAPPSQGAAAPPLLEVDLARPSGSAPGGKFVGNRRREPLGVGAGNLGAQHGQREREQYGVAQGSGRSGHPQWVRSSRWAGPRTAPGRRRTLPRRVRGSAAVGPPRGPDDGDRDA